MKDNCLNDPFFKSSPYLQKHRTKWKHKIISKFLCGTESLKHALNSVFVLLTLEIQVCYSQPCTYFYLHQKL